VTRQLSNQTQQQTLTTSPISSGILQRKCVSCGQHTIAGGECTGCQKKWMPLQRRSANQAEPSEVPPIVHEVLRSPGQPLDPATRTNMESRFGHDFSKVRVHTDTKALESAHAVSALAYTVQQNIVFGKGQYSPNTTQGQHLLAHELAHVIQQADQSVSPPAALSIGSVDNVYEQEAETSANGVVSGSSAIRQYPFILRKSSNATIMRTPVFTSTMEICRRLLTSQVFHISQGGVVVTAHAGWEASPEWEGSEPPQCGSEVYDMTLNQKGLIFDSEYGSCGFEMGRPFSRTWTNIPEGDYYLTIWTNNTNPNCCLRGDIIVSQEPGLSGETCTQPPPGPLEILHDALTLAGLIPVLGAIPDAIDAGLYVIEGNWVNAGISSAAMIPIFGEGATLTRLGVRVTGRSVERLGVEGIRLGIKEARAVRSLAKRIAGTTGLPHSFDRHAAQWFGRTVSRESHLSQWQELIERASQSRQIVNWSTGDAETIGHLARIDGKYFFVQFFSSGPRAGELATAFIPSQRQLSEILGLLR